MKSSELEAASWEECNRRINEEYQYSKCTKTSSNRFEDGVLHSETVIVHKNAPAVGVILVTALAFLLVGALAACGILAARFIPTAKLLHTNGDSSPQSNAPMLRPNQGEPNGGRFELAESPLTEIYDASVSGVVLIRSYSDSRAANGKLAGEGTGFFLTEDGYILTNAHVVEGAKAVRVELYDGTLLDASIIGRDNRTDIAVLSVPGSGYAALPLGNSDDVRIGGFVMTIGHPTGEQLGFTATFGIVGSVNRKVNIDGITNEYIQIDAAINPGNSGGPLFDMSGRVIGINSAKTVAAGYDEQGEIISADGLGFSLPINAAASIAEEIIANNGNVARPGLGLSVIAIDQERAEQYDIPQGMLIYKVIKDGPAHMAGLHIDDIITEVDGIAVRTTDEFVDIIQRHRVGDELELQFWRDGEELSCTITVGNFNEIGDEALDNAYGGEKYGIK